ncbi:MAG: hypothetical protein HY586_06665 [Candidatus Omnitrophica bacterium]|nr:hypothetical protein [Candidatus Omnitrophota bacterium]
MTIVTDQLTFDVLKQMAGALFENMVKGVVDVERNLLALDAELHSDLEALLLQDGSRHKNLWGINLYPELEGGEFIEFDSMINIKPAQGNRSRGVDNPEIRNQIIQIVKQKIIR